MAATAASRAATANTPRKPNASMTGFIRKGSTTPTMDELDVTSPTTAIASRAVQICMTSATVRKTAANAAP
jgi:hypothetical protein